MGSPRTHEAALPGGSVDESLAGGFRRDFSTLRNRKRIGTWSGGDCGREDAGRPVDAGGVRSLLTAPGATPREAWIAWLAPHFTANDSAYITGTYSDEYGYSNGLMLPRNVHKDVERFIGLTGFLDLDARRYICGVERHQYRDVLHWHGIIQGPFTTDELRYLKLLWQLERGYARVLPVLDGCASYVTKYALKGDTDSFGWRL